MTQPETRETPACRCKPGNAPCGGSANEAHSPSAPAAKPENPYADFSMGGQAVIEGVMIRGPKSYAVAVRRPQGDIVVRHRPFLPITKRKKWLRLPIVRGAVSLFEMLLLGYRTLEYSANIAEEGLREQEEAEKALAIASGEAAEPDADSPAPGADVVAMAATPVATAALGSSDSPESELDPASAKAPDSKMLGGWQMAGLFALSMLFAMLLFVALPNIATHLLGKLLPIGKAPVTAMADGTVPAGAAEKAQRPGLVEVDRPLLFNLVSGAVRVVVIVLYIWLISLMSDVRRLFQYHGAEHKVVMAFEKKIPLEIERLRSVTTLHPRCGTTFIAIVLMVSILVFAVLAALIVRVYPPFADWSAWAHKPLIILLHIFFMPLVAGMAYEITRRAGKRPDFLPYRILLWPGFAFQRITTREPDDSMLEVALRSFNQVLEPEQRAELAQG